MAQYPIPKRISLDDLKDILKGYYVEGGHNEPVSTTEVEETTQLSDRVGRQTDFLVSIGLLEKEGRQRTLTDAGEEIAESLMGGNEEMARSRMREVLTDWEFTNKIQGFVRMQGPVGESQLSEYITANIESDDTRGKGTLVELFLWTDILEESEEGTYNVSESKGPEKRKRDGQDSGDDKDIEEEKSELQQNQEMPPSSSSSGQINVDFQFSAGDDPEDIIQTIIAARKALEAPEDIWDELPEESIDN